MTRAEIEEYRERFRRFNEWEAEHPIPERPASRVLADIDFLVSLLPEEERRRDPDPEKLGIQRLRARLALLRRNG